jgi:hypothetical protein
MAYDPVRKKIVVFGGYWRDEQDVNDLRYGDTWEFDPRTGQWRQVAQAAPGPSPRNMSGMAFDDASGNMVLFGGRIGDQPLGDTWAYDGEAGTWTQAAPAGPTPPARYGHQIGRDKTRGVPVLVSGRNLTAYLTDVWDWNGGNNTWTFRSDDAALHGRTFFGLASDDARGRFVVFGGWGGSTLQYLGDTWEWDPASAAWDERSPGATAPNAREGHAMAYDAARRRTILFGGKYAGSKTDDLWEWDGAGGTWRALPASGAAPESRFNPAMAYEETGGTMIMFGGQSFDGRSYLDDTWELDSGAAGRAAAIWEVPFAAAGTGGAVISRMSVRFVAGGQGEDPRTGAQVNGVSLLAWDAVTAAWVELATNGASGGAPATVIKDLAAADAPDRFLFGTRKTVTVAAAPNSINGGVPGYGQVAVDYVEMTIRYHLD